jgi:hypothetical protein
MSMAKTSKPAKTKAKKKATKSRKAKKPVAVKDLGAKAAKSMKTGLAAIRRRLV